MGVRFCRVDRCVECGFEYRLEEAERAGSEIIETALQLAGTVAEADAHVR